MLNRNWSIEGKVIKGQKRGRKIGFPTCNLKLNNYVIPRLGVYAVKVKNNKLDKNGIANIGYRPTFNGQNLLLETNIFGHYFFASFISSFICFFKYSRPVNFFSGLINLLKLTLITLLYKFVLIPKIFVSNNKFCPLKVGL